MYKGGILNNKELIHLVFKKITFGDVLSDNGKKPEQSYVNIEKIILSNNKLLDKNKLKKKTKKLLSSSPLSPVSTTSPPLSPISTTLPPLSPISTTSPPLSPVSTTSPPLSPTSTESKNVENIYDDDSFFKAYAFNKLTNMSYLLLKIKDPSKGSGKLTLKDYTLYAEPYKKGWSNIKSLNDNFRKNLVLLEDYDKTMRTRDDIEEFKNEIKEELDKILNTELNDEIKIKKIQDLLITLLSVNLEEYKVFKQHNEKDTINNISKKSKGKGFQSNIIAFAKAWVKEYPDFKNSVFEDVHGDNNCFYRAYLNGLLYLLLNKKGEEKNKNYKRELLNLNCYENRVKIGRRR